MTKLEVLIDMSPSKEAKDMSKCECKSPVITFGGRLDEDKVCLKPQKESAMLADWKS